MKKSGIVLLILGCLSLLGGVGQNYVWASCSNTEGLPYDPADILPIRLHDLTPLEARIADVKLQMQNYGSPTPLDDATFQQLKLEVAELYAQLPREHNSLDDGSDACPATALPAGIVPYTDFGTTVGAANNFSSVACGGNSAPDKIYSYTPSYTGFFVFDTFGSNFDTQLYIRTGGVCPGTSEIACNDDAFSSQSQVIVLLNGGQTYYVIVDGFQSYSGNFTLHITGNCIIGDASDWQHECAESAGDPTHAAWDCNGGCGNQQYGGFPQWQQLNLCQLMRGECFTYQDPNNVSIRDVDNYYFTLTEPCSLSLNLYSSFSYNVLITDYGFCLPNTFFSLFDIPACNGGTVITPCLPAGTYSIMVMPNFFSGMTAPLPYVFSVDPIPCSGCRIDGSIQAPASFIASGCDGISHNSLRPSNDATYCVVIPYASDWTFTLCGFTDWNSYIYLTSQCNGGIIAQDNDGCAPGGLSKIECVPLQPGNYYFTVEGFNPTDCGQFYVTITSCQGSCCYGDMWNPSCANTAQSECDVLGGHFTLGGTCTPGLCYPRPGCEAPSAFSQQPHVPDESWTALASDNYLVNRVWENYSATGWIKSVRFWGLSLDYNTGLACTEQPGSFEITFVDSSNGPQVQTYNVQAFGLPLLQNYGANFVMTEYNVDLPTICGIQTGRISIRGSDSDACVWHWATSPQGNGAVVLVNSGGPISLPYDMAVCLERGCPNPDSLVINIHNLPAGLCQLNFHVPFSSFVGFYYSDSINAVFPATYLPIYSGWLAAGNYGFVEPLISTNRRFIAIADCSEPQMDAKGSEDQTEPEK